MVKRNSKTQSEYSQLSLIAEEKATYTIDDIQRVRKGDIMKIYTKESLIEEFKKIRDMGWIPNARHGNVGGVGNTLEDLLGIEENNLPIPNAAEWELKCQRADTKSLITLFHMEPSPRAFGFVPKVFLPLYGWLHEEAGFAYGPDEMSFRQTISGHQRSDRGFKVIVDNFQRKVLISFDANTVDFRHSDWLNRVAQRVGLDELNPQPYWGFDDLRNKAGTKLLNCFYIQADVRRERGREFFHYSKIMMLRGFSLEGFVLLHTFAHILMNRLTFECGYSSAALKERLYVSNDIGNPMSGVLIYTADGDAEGTMGGLVRMGKQGYIEPIIKHALQDATWCSADPVCTEIGGGGGQGPDSCNLAACHNCALVPETACEQFNRFLDRAVVVGDINRPNIGYFRIR